MYRNILKLYLLGASFIPGDKTVNLGASFIWLGEDWIRAYDSNYANYQTELLEINAINIWLYTCGCFAGCTELCCVRRFSVFKVSSLKLPRESFTKPQFRTDLCRFGVVERGGAVFTGSVPAFITRDILGKWDEHFESVHPKWLQ